MPGYELIGKEEQNEINHIFDNGAVFFRHGFDAKRNGCFKVVNFEKSFQEVIGTKHALAVSSGTAALRLALAALDIGSGDEVITQCFTFVATVEAIIESGAKPICCEIDSTLNMDPLELSKLITEKTKAVIVVHMLGVPARLNEIIAICKMHNIKLIEDTAWGCGGKYGDKFLGTLGDIGAFSFDYAKTITTGEGGMLVTNNEATYKKAAAWHDHGHENNPKLPRWEDSRASSGFNFRMSELQGAMGVAQLRKLNKIVLSQRANKKLMWDSISGIRGLVQREIPEGSFETADALIFFVSNPEIAHSCREQLLENGLSTKILPEAYTWHFAGAWNHMPELLNSHSGDLDLAFPKSKDILSKAVSLPVMVNMASDYPKKMHDAVLKAIENA